MALTAPFESLGDAPLEALAPTVSTLGLRLRVGLDDIEALLETALPDARPESGRRRLCRRVLGVQVCGTARWALALSRPGPVRFDRTDAIAGELPTARVPLAITGVVGVEGRLARTLGLDDVEVDALADVRIDLEPSIGPDWCPRVRIDVTHRWRRAPTLGWRGGPDLDVSRLVDEAIERELGRLGPRLDEAIDCDRSRRSLAAAWRSRSIELELPELRAAG